MRSAFRQSTKVPFPFPTPHSCRSRRGSPKPYLDKHIPRTSVDSPSSQVRRSEAWKRTIQPQAATSFALIPDWLRFAHFLASSRRKAGSAGRKRPGTVGLSRAFPRGTRFRSCRSSNQQVPLECRAAIQRRAVVPLGGLGGLDFLMLGQQLLEPADVPLDDRADEDQRLGLIAGRRGDLAIGHKLEAALIAQRQPISALLPELVADAVAERIEGMEEGIEFRVEVRLDTALTHQPDESDDFRISPGGFAVQNVQ